MPDSPDPRPVVDERADTARGWLVVAGPLQNQHVIPADQQETDAEHEPSVGCWCWPMRAFADSPDLMGGQIYLHRRSLDHSHRYSDRDHGITNAMLRQEHEPRPAVPVAGAEADGIWPNGLGCPQCDGTGFLSDEYLARLLDHATLDPEGLAQTIERARALRAAQPEDDGLDVERLAKALEVVDSPDYLPSLHADWVAAEYARLSVDATEARSRPDYGYQQIRGFPASEPSDTP